MDTSFAHMNTLHSYFDVKIIKNRQSFNKRIVSRKPLRSRTSVVYLVAMTKSCKQFLRIFVLIILIVCNLQNTATQTIVHHSINFYLNLISFQNSILLMKVYCLKQLKTIASFVHRVGVNKL